MILKKEHSYLLDLNYLRYTAQLYLLSAGFSWSQKAGKEVMQTVLIKIPINATGEFDLERQKEIAKRFELIEKILE